VFREVAPDVEVKQVQEDIEKVEGSTKKQTEEDKLLSSVLQSDKDRIEQGRMLNEAINKGLMSFSPDIMMSQIVKNYQLAEQLYGETILKYIGGYNPDYIEKNINIPEFQRELTKIIKDKIDELKKEGILDKEGAISDAGYDLAGYVLYIQELENMLPSGAFGKRVHKKFSHYGDKQDVRRFKAGDRYKDLAIKDSVRMAIRRGHSKLISEDLRTYDRKKRGEVYVLYGLDASGSMKGKKLEAAKKAGIALAHQAIEHQDHAGVVVFGSDVVDHVEPCRDFHRILKAITRVRASRETEFAPLIRKAIELFPRVEGTKHLVILTDAMPTVGDNPARETLEAIAQAKDQGITISVVGINLDDKGEQLAQTMVRLGDGRLYAVRNLDKIDTLVLEDYFSIR